MPRAWAISSVKTLMPKDWKIAHTERSQPIRTLAGAPAFSRRMASSAYGRDRAPRPSSSVCGLAADGSKIEKIVG